MTYNVLKMIVTTVYSLPEYKLHVTFDDGVSGIIDLKTFVENGIFSVLKNEDAFNKVYTNGYSVAWNDDLEVDALTIYAELLNKNPEDFLSSYYTYTTN